MKILIKGTIECPPNTTASDEQKHSYEQKQQQFIAACKALGAALAGRGHTIMLGVPQWEKLREGRTVTTYVIEGANLIPQKDNKRHNIIFYGPMEPEPRDTTDKVLDTLQEIKNLPNIALIDKFLGKGDWSAAMIPDVSAADALIMIGGGEGTASIGYAAYSMMKPVVAITAFNGAAESMCKEQLFTEYERFVKQDDISPSELRMLNANWSSKDDSPENAIIAQGIVSLTEKLIKVYGQSNSRSSHILLLTVLGLLIFLPLWVVIFLQLPIGLTRNVAFFLLLFISAVLGTGLRTLTSYQENRIVQLHYLGLGIDITIALLVAFGLALIYLIGGISFTGKVVVLQSQSEETFASIALTMSLLGLTAGYLVPLDRIRQQLEKMITQSEALS